jgi:hypothetical protein
MFQIVWLMHMKIIIVYGIGFYRVGGFKIEQRTVNKFCVKLKKIAIKIFGMSKSAYGEECSSRKSVFQ